MQLGVGAAIEIAYALGIGVLVGVERSIEDTDEDQPSSTPEGDAKPAADMPADLGDQPGARTFGVVSLVGYTAAAVSEHLAFTAPAALLAVTLLVIAMYFRARHNGLGITTEAALIGTAALGMLCRGSHAIAGVVALLVTILLASKRFTRGAVKRMRRVELTDTLKFLGVILIVLPLLPNRTLDPYQVFNPYKTGLLVVLISGIGFAGYFLTRFLGARRGLGLTGIIGGLTSSTAVTAAMAQRAKEEPSLTAICVFSTIAANATMFVRVLLVVAVLDVALVKRLAWPIGAMTLSAAVATAVLWVVAGKGHREGESESQVPLKNPFSLGPALKFAAFFVFILFLLKLAKLYLGSAGLYVAAAVSGLADVDAITLSVSEQTKAATLPRGVGAIAITIAVVSNSVTKTGIAISTGGWKFGRLVALCLGGATLVGLAVAFVAP